MNTTKKFVVCIFVIIFIICFKKHMIYSAWFINIYFYRNNTEVIGSLYMISKFDTEYKKEFYEFIADKTTNSLVRDVAHDLASD